jgi:hypothetical protein
VRGKNVEDKPVRIQGCFTLQFKGKDFALLPAIGDGELHISKEEVFRIKGKEYLFITTDNSGQFTKDLGIEFRAFV